MHKIQCIQWVCRRGSVIIVIIYSHHSSVVCSDIIYNKIVDNIRWRNKWVSNIEGINHFNNNIIIQDWLTDIIIHSFWLHTQRCTEQYPGHRGSSRGPPKIPELAYNNNNFEWWDKRREPIERRIWNTVVPIICKLVTVNLRQQYDV